MVGVLGISKNLKALRGKNETEKELEQIRILALKKELAEVQGRVQKLRMQVSELQQENGLERHEDPLKSSNPEKSAGLRVNNPRRGEKGNAEAERFAVKRSCGQGTEGVFAQQGVEDKGTRKDESSLARVSKKCMTVELQTAGTEGVAGSRGTQEKDVWRETMPRKGRVRDPKTGVESELRRPGNFQLRDGKYGVREVVDSRNIQEKRRMKIVADMFEDRSEETVGFDRGYGQIDVEDDPVVKEVWNGSNDRKDDGKKNVEMKAKTGLMSGEVFSLRENSSVVVVVDNSRGVSEELVSIREMNVEEDGSRRGVDCCSRMEYIGLKEGSIRGSELGSDKFEDDFSINRMFRLVWERWKFLVVWGKLEEKVVCDGGWKVNSLFTSKRYRGDTHLTRSRGCIQWLSL